MQHGHEDDPHHIDPHYDVHGDPHHDSAYDEYAHHSEEESSHYHHEQASAPKSIGGVVPPGGGDSDSLFDSDADGEGGPVKTFLEHLEDFRWVLIKVAASIMIAMVVCLMAGNWIVTFLKWPLERSSHLYPDPRQHVSVMLGPKEVLHFKLDTNNLPGWPIATNKFIELELTPIDLGTNKLLALGVRSTNNEVPPEKAKPIIYKSPAEPFLNSLHIAFFGGLLLAAPFVIFYITQFVLPALKARERKYFMKAMTPAVFLFILGVSLCYFVLLPLALNAADKWSAWMGVDMPFWQASEYFSFCIKFMLGMGLGFEMPVILLALVKIGLLNYQMLASFRRYMVLINLVLGALLTTPEVLTQVAMFFPLQFLYEVSIWIAWYWEQPDRRLARRRLVTVIASILLLIVLGWLGWRYGWPWLKPRLQ